MRKKIIAGNWKMNLDATEAISLFKEVGEIESASGLELVVFPPAIYLDRLIQENQDHIKIGAQNGYPVPSGAFTGEISMTQLQKLGAQAVLIGHSERRMYFSETNQLLKEKTDAALQNNLQPFFCCGEPLEVREGERHLSFVKQQLTESLFHLSALDFQETVIAYEPIWAIGTGLTASVEQAEEMHLAIRSWIEEAYSAEIAANYSILYGGSCNPSNAAALFACPNVDGGLIGGAALKAPDFAILAAAATWITSN